MSKKKVIKSKSQKKAKKKESKSKKNEMILELYAEGINVFWTVSDNWFELPYAKKAEWYWKFQHGKNGRVFSLEDEE